MKLGKEVEGKFSGLYTLFMTAQEAIEFFNYKSLKDRALPFGAAQGVDHVQHIYISDHLNILHASHFCLFQWNNLNLPVTIECTALRVLRDEYPPNVHIMLAVANGLDINSFWSLLPTDQIKFSRPYNGSHQVKCVMVGSMINTEPEAFGADIEFTASRAKKYLSPT